MNSVRRIGLMTKKLGMSAIYKEDGSRIAVTLLKIEDNQVLGVKTIEKHGYNAVQLGYGVPKVKRAHKSHKSIFAAAKINLKRKIREFRISENAILEAGQIINIDHFVEGQFIDATAVTIGKGFAGGMKRHNFRGLEASHGVSVSHRSIGSTGQRQDPGKVFKGKKMPGHMGVKRVTLQNLEVISTNIDRGIIIVKGAVPGHKDSYVMIRDAIKRALPDEAPFPASIKNNDSAIEDKNEN